MDGQLKNFGGIPLNAEKNGEMRITPPCRENASLTRGVSKNAKVWHRGANDKGEATIQPNPKYLKDNSKYKRIPKEVIFTGFLLPSEK